MRRGGGTVKLVDRQYIRAMLSLFALLQVAVSPTALTPASMERLAVRVANPSPSPIILVAVAVPEAITVLGVEAPPGWTARVFAASDTTPQAVEWSGSALAAREFKEFAFFA